MGTFGQVEITVPRARLDTAEGKTTEWRSSGLRDYQRRTQASRFADCRRLSWRDQYASGAETAAMLFWALPAAGQITMRKVDGWQTLTYKLADKPIGRSARTAPRRCCSQRTGAVHGGQPVAHSEHRDDCSGVRLRCGLSRPRAQPDLPRNRGRGLRRGIRHGDHADRPGHLARSARRGPHPRLRRAGGHGAACPKRRRGQRDRRSLPLCAEGPPLGFRPRRLRFPATTSLASRQGGVQPVPST